MKNNIKTNSETVVIKMSDFYPDNVGGKEFCEVSREVYEELLRFKAVEEGKTDVKSVAENLEVSVRIRVAEFYPDNCCDDKYCNVSMKVYEQLCREKVRERSQKRKDRRQIATYNFDEDKLGEMYGIFSKSAEDECYENGLFKKLNIAIQKINPVLFKRFFRHYVLGIRTSQIAREEGISHTGVIKSYERVREQLRKYLNEQ